MSITYKSLKLDQSTRTTAELARKWETKKEYIFNWFKDKTSSAISEGFNNKVKKLKRMAYGYRDIE